MAKVSDVVDRFGCHGSFFCVVGSILPKRACERQYEVVGRHWRDFGCCQTRVLRQNVEIVNVSHAPFRIPRSQREASNCGVARRRMGAAAFEWSVNEQATVLFQ